MLVARDRIGVGRGARRNGVYWFRKVTPIDLVSIIGQAELRCSLRTTRRDVAKRRAHQVLVALEHVYELLRSEQPLEPAKILLTGFAEDFVNRGSTDTLCYISSRNLKQAADILGTGHLACPFTVATRM
jgi:hypothetical protein